VLELDAAKLAFVTPTMAAPALIGMIWKEFDPMLKPWLAASCIAADLGPAEVVYQPAL